VEAEKVLLIEMEAGNTWVSERERIYPQNGMIFFVKKLVEPEKISFLCVKF
jgi:hypothetical protein